MSFLFTRAWAVAFAGIVMVSSADAQVYSGQASIASGTTNQAVTNTSTPASYSTSGLFGSASSTTTSASGGSVYATVSTIAPGGGVAYAQITYSFQIVGSGSTYALPVAVSASGYVDGSGFYYLAYDTFTVAFDSPQTADGVFHPGINQTVESASFSPFSPGYQTFSYNNTVTMPVNSNINVTLLANINVGACCAADGTPSTGTAFLDPTFTLVGDFGDFHIQGVPGAVSAVPEPSTWAMMIIGFAGIGTMAFRRRKGQPPAA